MIKRSFWEKVAEDWSRIDDVKIPEVNEGPDVPEDFLGEDDIGDLDDLLMSFGLSEEEEIDFFSL